MATVGIVLLFVTLDARGGGLIWETITRIFQALHSTSGVIRVWTFGQKIYLLYSFSGGSIHR